MSAHSACSKGSVSMASPRSSSLGFAPRQTELLADQPREWEATWLVLGVPVEDWENASVSWNGTPLEVQLRQSRAQGRWVVAELPLLEAGFHRFLVRASNHHEEQVVRVSPRKLDDAAFERMLLDLQQGLGPELAVALKRCGALAGLDLHAIAPPTLAGERLRLQQAILGGSAGPGLLALLPQLAKDCHRRLVQEHRWVAGYAARRLVPSLLQQALVRSGNVDAAGQLVSVADGRAVATADTYENQIVHTFVTLVRARLGRFVAACRALGHQDLVHEAAGWMQRLDLARAQASFLDEVLPLAVVPSQVTMVLARKPAYRASLEGLRRFLRSCSVQCDPTWLDAPLENLPMLYQLWGTLQVHAALLELAAELGFTVRHQRLITALPTGLYVKVLPDGKPSLVLEHPSGVRLTLTPERTFGSSGALRSLTYPQRPDLTVEIRRGEQVELWLFDPKYKLSSEAGAAPGEGRPTKVDLDKMHAYRDAIRGPDGQQVVRFAATLYPGPTEVFGNALAAVRAWPGEEQGLRNFVRAQVGRQLQKMT